MKYLKMAVVLMKAAYLLCAMGHGVELGSLE